MTSAFLNACENSPEESDLFIISMIMGVKIVLQDFTSPVAKGSSAHCLFGEAAMMHCISCSLAGCRVSIGALTRGHGWGAASYPVPSVVMDALMATILLMKNSLKLSSKMSTGFLCNGMDCFLPRRVLTTLFLIVFLVVTYQVCVVVSFCLSDQIIHVATPLHEDVTM